MNETEIFNFIFKFSEEGATALTQELAELYVQNEKLKNQALEYQSTQRKLNAERKTAAEESKAAAIAEVNSRLGIQNGVKTEIGLIQRLTSEIKLLKSAREQANNVSDVNKYTGAIQAAQKELNALTGVTDKFRGSNGFWQDLKGQVMAYWAAVQVGDVGKTLINNEVRLEALRLALRNVLSTQEEYTQSLTFLDNLSNKYGQDITILTGTYKNFIAASQSSGLELKERNRIYEAIVKSGAALSLSNEEIEGSLRAVSQMFSKGNVQAEELRGQLGERLPGAFGLAAKALGVTESKLNDMLKAGQVLAVDLLPKLATELEKAFGDKAANNVNLVTGAYNRLTNSIKDYFGEANQNYGITDKIAKGFNFLADNLKEVVSIGASVISTIVAYTIASKAAAGASAAWTVIEKAGLIIKGEAILLTKQQSIANATLTDTQLTAAAAAQTFNNTLLKNPIGLIVLAIGTAITAYQLYNASVEDAAEEQKKLNKQITDAIAPLELQKREFNSLANEVLKGVVPLQKQYDTLEALKKQYPELLKGVTSLTEAERILNENKIKVNTQDDYRLEKLEALKAQYPEQLKGINNLKDAEEKLGKVIRDVNADFAVRATLLEAEIKYDINREKATNLIKQQIDAEGKLVNIRKQLSIETKNSLEGREEFISSLREEEKQYQGVINAAKAGVVNLIGVNQSITKIQEDAKKRLKYSTDEVVKITKDGEDKKTKIKADSAATQALIAEKTRITELEKSEVQEQKLLAIDKDIAIQRIKDSKKATQEKASEIYKIEEKFKQDLNRLTQKYDDKEQEDEIKNGTLVAKIRADFRVINEKDEKKSLDAQIKAIEAKYKNEIDIVSKSSKSYSDKKAEITKLVIEEEKELLTIRRQIQFLVDLDKLHKEQSRNIKQITKDILEKWNIQDKVDKEEIEHQRELIKLYDERQKVFGDMVASIVPEIKGLMDYNDAVNNAGRALTNFADQKIKLHDIEKKSGIQSAEFLKQLEITNKAQEESVKANTESMVSQYQLLYKAVEFVFNEIKQAASKAFRAIGSAAAESNKIYQDFVKQQRNAELAAYKTDLNYRLGLIEGNYDAQIDLLKEYLAKAEGVIKKVNLSEDIAAQLQISTEKIVGFTNYVSNEIEQFSLNPFTMAKNAFRQLGVAIAGWKKENTDAAEKAIIASTNAIENLQWQRDESLKLLDDIADTYKDKYDGMLDAVKKGLSEQVDAIKEGMGASIDAIRNSLDKQIEILSSWYDGQKDIITQRYADILDNNVRYTDIAFEEQLAIWNAARTDQENILIGQRDTEKDILKQKYKEGKISLEEYTAQAKVVDEKYFSDILALRTKFYDDLQAKTTQYNSDELNKLKDSLSANLITQEEYDAKVGTLEDLAKQRSADIKSLVRQDRDKDLSLLKSDYLDLKEMAEQKSADAILKIQTDSATAIKKAEKDAGDEIIRLTTERNNKLADLARQRLLTELTYNSQIFEQQRALANAQALVAMAQAKAEAWKNPFTAKAVIGQIQQAFAEIFAAIGSAVNPFDAEIVKYVPVTPDTNNPVEPPPGGGEIGDGGAIKIAKGIDRLPNTNGKVGVDTQPAMLDVGERVIPTYLNDMLKSKLGVDVTNKQLVNMALGQFDFQGIANTGKNVSSTDPRLVNAINGLSKEMKNLKQVNVNVKNGVPTIEERSYNRMIKYTKP